VGRTRVLFVYSVHHRFCTDLKEYYVPVALLLSLVSLPRLYSIFRIYLSPLFFISVPVEEATRPHEVYAPVTPTMDSGPLLYRRRHHLLEHDR
jgi:hypothetical protein